MSMIRNEHGLMDTLDKFKRVCKYGTWFARFTVLSCSGVISIAFQSKQSGGQASKPGRFPSLERHNKKSPARCGLLCFCNPGNWSQKPQLHFNPHLLRHKALFLSLSSIEELLVVQLWSWRGQPLRILPQKELRNLPWAEACENLLWYPPLP